MDRVRLDGKFFRLGEARFQVRGTTYGTFATNKAGEPFPEPAEVQRDLVLIRELGANTIRIYDVPPPWLLDAAAALELRFFVSVPWDSGRCFLATRTSRREARTAVVSAVRSLNGHPAVFAVGLANEIPADVVRWSGTDRVAAFLDELVFAAHDADPGCLCTFANFPTTEFLQPRHLDFVTFNVFLHDRTVLADYLVHLQIIAGDKPLLLGECGADARREGTEGQEAILTGNLAAASDAGLAGAIVFAFTDDWVRGGRRVEDWQMGLTTIGRERRPAFTAVQERFLAPRSVPVRTPKVSVVVATYNGGATLPSCLESLQTLDYPHYEVIVIDDGSTDETSEITTRLDWVRTLRHKTNFGLSAARNLGTRAATGEIVAFTDADCRVDRDWLSFLVAELTRTGIAGVGGPNLLPPDDPPLAAAVMASPGGPVHVLLTDRIAEHIPGCNMAFWKWALDDIGGFDIAFRRAGDDVDLCWRMQRRGWQLGFAPAGFVWHHRRSSVSDYLRQQAVYGEAEALLVNKHPEHFNALGCAQWRGRICAGSMDLPWRRPVVHHGIFATGLFQTLYTSSENGLVTLINSVEYHAVIALPLLILSFVVSWLWPLALVAWLVPPFLCALAAGQAMIPGDRRRWWSRPLIAILHYLQPFARGAARYRTRLNLRATAMDAADSLEARSRVYDAAPAGEKAYASATWRDRREWLELILRALDRHHWACRADAGWSPYDIAVFGSRWSWLEFVTVAESNRDGSQTLRGRLRPRWTLTADLFFWSALALQILVIGIVDATWKVWWTPIVTQAVIAAAFHHQARNLQCRFSVLLDAVARDWQLIPVATPRPASPVSAPEGPANERG